MRNRSKLLPTLLVLPLLAAAAPAAEPGAGSPVGRTIDNFRLTDPRTGKPVALADFKDRKAVAVVFLGTRCPVNNQYLPRLNQLQKEYAGKGVQILGINSNHIDSLEDVAAHAREHGIAFPVLKDLDGRAADRFGATMTPEAFVLDADRVVRYRGRIDDQYGRALKKLNPTTRELADALDAVLAGKPVAVAETEVAGCWIARRPIPNPNAKVSFTRDIAPLLQKHCQECHRPGQIGPMPLLTYADAAGWSETIRYVVEERFMPPWYADPKFGRFANDRRLPDADRELLLRWIDQGCPEGDPKDMPPPREFSSEWRIGKPDLVLTMSEEFEVPAEMPEGGIPYKYFIVDPGFKEDVWVRRAEARAGAPDVVHHIVAFIVPPPDNIDPDYPNFPFLPGVKNARVLCGTAPGDMPTVLPEGTAIRIPAGSKIVFQMHYTPSGRAAKDRSRVGIVFAPGKPKREVITVPVFNHRIKIPPGEADYEVHSWFTFKHDGHIIALMPHMHLRGKDFKMSVVSPDGKEERTILSVPNYNFNWQNAYRLAEPLPVPRGGKVHCVAHYDNSAANPHNPDPQAWVYWGDQTWQEMMIGWMDMVYDREPR
ncbi:MAG TPA: thioredoxin family protein [Gemmataceae bacterium]